MPRRLGLGASKPPLHHAAWRTWHLPHPSLDRLPYGLTVPRLAFAALGFLPITALSASLFGFIPLHVSVRYVVIPGAFVAVGLAARFRDLGERAFEGLVSGMLATAAYDALRLSLVGAGLWGDFIPNIGKLALLDDSASPFWGYLWRFLGNGGAMGMAYAVLPFRGVRHGLAFGTFVCGCLFATLVFAPHAQEMLFRLRPLTAAGALVGHLVYGGVLGAVVESIPDGSSHVYDDIWPRTL